MKLRNPIAILCDYLRTLVHDRYRWDRNLLSVGLDWQHFQKFAVMACYSGPTPAASVLASCAHLRDWGYGVVLVSNCPLNEVFVERAKESCIYVMQRQNWGYDFGAYRDGIHYLFKLKVLPRPLILLNDSIFYPINDEDQMLAAMERSDLGIVGAAMVRENRKGLFGPKKEIVGSFFIRFSESAVASQGFIRYWRRYRLTNAKHSAVRHGEHRLTEAMREAGHVVGAIVSWQDVLTHIETLSDEAYAIYFPNVSRGELRRIATGAQKRLAVIQVSAAFSVMHLGLNLIKRVDVAAAQSLVQAPSTMAFTSQLDGPSSVIWAEIMSLIRKRPENPALWTESNSDRPRLNR